MIAANGLSTSTLLDDLSTYALEYKNSGTVLLPHGLVFDQGELDRLDAIQSQIPEERVTEGDANDTHDLYVRRMMTDKAGELATRVNQPYSDQILEILDDARRKKFLADIVDPSAEYFIRRCQTNRLTEGSFVGLHLDAESNPDYDFSMIIQFGRNFEGGEFVVYPEGRDKQVFSPTYGTVVITTCKFRHEVTKVTAGERNALVYFYSKNNGLNRRQLEGGMK